MIVAKEHSKNMGPIDYEDAKVVRCFCFLEFQQSNYMPQLALDRIFMKTFKRYSDVVNISTPTKSEWYNSVYNYL